MSLSAAPLSLDIVHGFLRALGCDPGKVEEVHFNRDHLDVVVTAEDGCSTATRHRLVESPTSVALRQAITQAASGRRVGILFNSQAEAASVLRALYDQRETLLEGIPHTFYLAAGRVEFPDQPGWDGRVDFVNIYGTSYRGTTWDLAYHPADLSDNTRGLIIPAVPSGTLIPY